MGLCQISDGIFRMPNWLEENFSSFEYGRKITLTTCLQKARRGRESSLFSLLTRYNTYASWLTTSTIKINGNHDCFFIWIPILDHALVHSVDKTHVLTVTVELIWLLFLNIFFFNFFVAPNKSLRFTKFRKSYLNHNAVFLINHCQSYTAFLLDVRCSKWPHSLFFCSCLSLIIVHLRNLFLLITGAAQMSLTQMWVSRRKIVT